MKRNKAKKTKLVAILLILVLLISIGYAALTTNLTINGNATVKAQNWSVYFDNVDVTTGSVTANPAPTTSGTTTTTLSWTVSMDTPGQFYEFYVDVVNAGSMDAMIGSLSNTTLTSAQADYLNYTVTYDDGSPIEQYDTLPAHSDDTLKVRLEFKTDIDPEDLPSTADQITLTYTSTYVQADNNAKPRTVAAVTPTVQSLAQAGTIKVGDYVNYTPSSGSVTVTSAQTGANNDQTFSTANDSSMTWRVLSVNSTTGEVKIVASPTSNDLELNGRAGFGNAETVLNSVASIYGGGTGAASVRSITEDDIFDAIGYNKTANYSGNTETYESGEYFTETWNGTTATYSTTTTEATAGSPLTLHNTAHNQYDANDEWVGGGINVASQTLENGTAAEKAEMQIYWDMLIGGDYEDVANGDTTGCFEYWCASRFAFCYSDVAIFSVRNVYDGGFNGGYGGYGSLFCSETDGYAYENSCSRAVAPVVTLQSNIGMEQDSVSGAWNFVQ